VVPIDSPLTPERVFWAVQQARTAWVFEDSPWVAERAWKRGPFATNEALYRAMVQEVECATRDEQLALLRAHPDLGARAKISAASAGEQAGAGLDALTSEESDRLYQLNSAYREKFGFPFLFAVKGSTRRDVFEELLKRLKNQPDEEFREALRQVYKIACFRLEGIA
jgi:2-oxo-4-hydroxy-4-carboxy-5-ureidoimidazoline decarboxylase